MQYLTLVHSSTRSEHHQDGFTSRDRIALTCWMQRSDAHGYRRVLVEDGSTAGGPEEGGYVLIYTPGNDWAMWGIARGREGVVIWHCGSGADLGRYNNLLDALESLPPAETISQRASAAGPQLASSRGLRAAAQPTRAKLRFALVHSA